MSADYSKGVVRPTLNCASLFGDHLDSLQEWFSLISKIIVVKKLFHVADNDDEKLKCYFQPPVQPLDCGQRHTLGNDDRRLDQNK
jgi:hypothetical protein